MDLEFAEIELSTSYELRDGHVYAVAESYEYIIGKEIQEYFTNVDEEYSYYDVKQWSTKNNRYEKFTGSTFEFNKVLYDVTDGTFKVPIETNDHEEITKETYSTVEVSSYDNLTNMDMLIGIDEKLNLIMEHLGLIS